jgi:type VI protein secretion system component VasK
MRLAVIVLAALVFAAGLILDTSALLVLAADALWARWRIVGAAVVLVACGFVVWRRSRGREVPRKPVPAGAKRAAARPRQTKAGGARGQRSPRKVKRQR